MKMSKACLSGGAPSSQFGGFIGIDTSIRLLISLYFK